MSETANKFRRATARSAQLAGDPITGRAVKRADETLERKGGAVGANLAKQSREKKEAKREQSQSLLRQGQAEQLRLEEAESEIGRKRLLAKRGGRRSLIASR